MEKFDFAIRTRDGQRVENILIAARDEAEAERKLRQMYRYCEVVSCNVRPAEGKSPKATSIEDILSLMPK